MQTALYMHIGGNIVLSLKGIHCYDMVEAEIRRSSSSGADYKLSTFGPNTLKMTIALIQFI